MPFFGGGGASVDLASPPAIGNTTPNTGAFTTLSATGLISGTTNSNFFSLNTISASNMVVGLIGLTSSSIFRFVLNPSNSNVGFRLDPAYPISWSSSSGGTNVTSLNNSGDLFVFRDAANTLAQRNSTNAQTFRLYNTFTDASNYERVDLRWTSNTFEINTRNGAAGTGTARNVHITIPNNGGFQINGGFGGGELFGIRNSYMGTAYGAEIGATGWRSAIRCLNFVSDRGISWSNSTSSFTTADCAIVRNSAGVLEINDGNTTGTFRDLIVRNFRMSAPTGVPTANNSTGTEGSIRWDADYIYICTATNTWKRVAIATWP